MRSSNPILRENVLTNTYDNIAMPMTVSGTLNKLLFLSLIMIVSAAAVYYQFSLQHIDFVNILMVIGIAVSFILSIIISFKPNTAPYLTPIYAFAQGAVLSGISCFFEAELPGIVIQAVSITFIVVFSMAFLYRTGMIRATEKFKAVIFTATLAILAFYFISFIMSLFGHLPAYFTSTSTMSICINAAIAVIAALNLIIDFDFIERGTQAHLPIVYEWYGAFGLLVTILWLYIEILSLLARTRRR